MIDRPLESFVFYRSFRDAIEEMTDENKLATLLAICDYALYGVVPDLKDAMSRAVFTVARPSIDANKGRRANGKLGGRPPKKPMVSDSENHRFPKMESTETETVSETEAKETDKPPHPRFIPPTVDEVKAYCQERHSSVDPVAFVSFYESKGWMVGKNKMRSWKSAISSWERRDGSSQAEQLPTMPRVAYHTEIVDGEEVDVPDGP